MLSTKRSRALLPAAAAIAAVGLAAATILFARRRHRRQRAADAAADEGAELARLLATIKAASSSTFLVVTNARGDAFAAKALASFVRRKKCGSEGAPGVLANARALAAFLATAPTAPTEKVLKHALVEAAISPALLVEKFPAVKAAYVQQPLDYGRNSRYGDKWKISCYLVVLEKWKPRIVPHAPMVDAMGDVMDECRRKFEAWYASRFGLLACEASVMNCFLTRYRPMPDEDQLEKHIDGSNVDGSVVLALPTDAPFAGGGLRVWDGKPTREFAYAMKPGDCLFLDTKVWHQGCPISTGERYALVLFLKLKKTYH